jgi:hypothetical protein
MARSTSGDLRDKIDTALGRVPGRSFITKFGHNPAVDGSEDIWGGGGIYAFYYTANQDVDALSTDVDDVGGLRANGTATGGGIMTLVDSGADFVGDSVAAGDVVINDTTGQFATVSAITATTLTHTAMSNASTAAPASTANAAGDTYRIGHSADTGAGVIHTEGLTNDSSGRWVVATETTILNGQTEVALSTGFVRLYRSRVVHAGSSGMNEGTINVQVVTTNVVGATINIGDGQTQQAIYTVPSGKVGLFTKGYVAMAGGGAPAQVTSAEFTWRARVNNGATGVFTVGGQVQLQTNGTPWWIYEYAVPVPVPEKTDVIIRCESTSAAGLSLVGSFEMTLESI